MITKFQPYVVNCPANQKHLRCGIQASNVSSMSNEAGKRQTRRMVNNSEKSSSNKTMESLNYWKRAFNQHEPAMTTASERFIRVGASQNRKAMFTSTHTCLAKEEGNTTRPPPQTNAKYLPKALLKTLSPIQNSPQFLLNNINSAYEENSKKFSGYDRNLPLPFPVHEQVTCNNSQVKRGKGEHDELDSAAPIPSSSSSNDLKHNNFGSENDPRVPDYDDDLVFSIEI